MNGLEQMTNLAEIHKRVFERSVEERDYDSARKHVENYISALELIQEITKKGK